ncbi:peptide-N(4)-(N-acetyl-beta-glucosaminyl)asparagine amidase isoform X2 [Oryza brachyantha]|uniref:peptide-N(4)-(N-acetyl-beta- glucosaminyl)asparagine amidase isoform X2 n=1 Tax=Oryza brachyantha TaxID=4533 RepID=UPI000776573E|nr:peptide-N(4)-(N-acetyl-beta-glucosaminyl)asparagine amidase isoform X2 [Oryza brachyantha]
MVARRFVVRQDPAGGGGEGEAEVEEHELEYDTEHGLDILRLQIFSLTSVPPELQKIVVEADGTVVGDGTDLEAISEGLRLVAISGEDDEEEGKDAAAAEAARAHEKSDEELARMIQAEEEALLLQQYSIRNDGGQEFRKRVEPYMHQVLMYEDPMRQDAARKTVPIDELQEKALISLAKEGNFSPSKDEEDHAFLLQLLFWFKQSFRWVNAAPCDSCGRETFNVGMGTPLPSELKFGANRVEIYRCNHCSSTTRFPRYNDPYKLIETRKGRCGEWANCFTFYCRTFGYEARLILDFTDHVWTECFSNLCGRWMHLDPCEGVYDNPLLYEKGWNKKLDYVIAISKDGVRDVTKRYTRKWHEVLSRRIITSEDTVAAILSSITGKYRSGLSINSLTVTENRDRKESEELSKAAYLEVDATISLPGRQSGSVEWRKARAELGQVESLAYSSCPSRKCVDAHVSKIYDALSALLSHFCDGDIPKERVIEVFDTLKCLMQNLKDAKFKSKRATLDKKTQLVFEEFFPSVERLLCAMSLKTELGKDGERSVTTAGNAIHTSLALPVAIDAVDEILSNYKSNAVCTKGHRFPRGNRLCSGSVLASGEQLPIGIATAAFDGIRSSKWEEPDGAKGCWIIYRMLDGQTCELESYDLMSANDVPERDPMDWVLEGSADGGSTWNTIDARSSVIFDNRFYRKTFTVDKSYKTNAFRFRFLRVRESNGNPRFQIGSIDLYGKST